MGAAGITVLGVGSFHGDDRIGWCVIDRLVAADLPQVKCVKVQVPIEIIESLAESAEVHVVDATPSIADGCLVRPLRYADVANRREIEQLPVIGTHQIGISQTLRLAESMQIPTAHVTIWIVKGESFGPLEEVSQTAAQAIQACTTAIVEAMGPLSR